MEITMRFNYYIETGTSSVTAWSTARIPFEPKGWLLEFRNQLRSAIAGLPSVDGRILYAAYRSPIGGYVDVENLLIYNVGPAYLASATKNGLVFKRFYQASRVCPVELISPVLHQYEYGLIDDKSQSLEGQDGSLLASLSFELSATALHSCAGIWYAAKKGSTTLTQSAHVAKQWGMFVTISGPSSTTIVCSRIVKPLIDGITSALHYHDGSNINYLSRQLGKNLGLSDDALIGTLLEDSSHALFGRTNLLYPYRNNVKWNPQDDYCTYCSMKCLYGLPPRNLKIDCRICDLSQHDTI
jgi:ferredoxin